LNRSQVEHPPPPLPPTAGDRQLERIPPRSLSLNHAQLRICARCKLASYCLPLYVTIPPTDLPGSRSDLALDLLGTISVLQPSDDLPTPFLLVSSVASYVCSSHFPHVVCIRLFFFWEVCVFPSGHVCFHFLLRVVFFRISLFISVQSFVPPTICPIHLPTSAFPFSPFFPPSFRLPRSQAPLIFYVTADSVRP